MPRSSATLCMIVLVSLVAHLLSAEAQPANPLHRIRFDQITGWTDDNHQHALKAFARSCREIEETGHGFKRTPRFGGTRQHWLEVCAKLPDAKNARAFFEQNFVPFVITDPDRKDGLLTGYYEPVAKGSLTQTAGYSVPVYARPPDLVAFDAAAQHETGLAYGRMSGGRPQAYLTREEIEKGALTGKGLEIVWLESWEDAFFIHIQGSGRVQLEQGGELRLAYAAKSGLPYTAIGGVLISRGVLTKETNSMQAIRAWMTQNEAAARELMWHNKSFVFFRAIEITDKSLGALGAQQVNLTPERSLAVDRSVWMFGTPIWIDTHLPNEATQGTTQDVKTYRRLMVAQDTGSAIKGIARGDVYWGWGAEAERIAGHMKSPARMTVLLPRKVAEGLAGGVAGGVK
jgi:membrane-bound lytic murein transglycosylase A